MDQFFLSDGQSIGVSTSASVLPMNIQEWFSLGWTGLISLQSKGPSGVFSKTTIQKHQFFSAQFSSRSSSHIHTWLPEKHRVGKICWRKDRLPTPIFLDFPCGSAGKESAWNMGDLGSIPGLGRSPGEGKGYPLHILAWRIPWTVWSMGLQTVKHSDKLVHLKFSIISWNLEERFSLRSVAYWIECGRHD